MATSGSGGPHNQHIRLGLFNSSQNVAKLSSVRAFIKPLGGEWRLASAIHWDAPEWLTPGKPYQLELTIGQVPATQVLQYSAQKMTVFLWLEVVSLNVLDTPMRQVFRRTITKIGPNATQPVGSTLGGFSGDPEEATNKNQN